MTVTLATHCHARDLPRLHAPGALEELIACHNYPFTEILVIHQRCGQTVDFDDGWFINDTGLKYQLPEVDNINVYNILEEDYPSILTTFGMNPNDTALDEITHGWSWQWYWKHHCVNHLREIMQASSDYIVFNDADCRIINQPRSWVERGIEILEAHPQVFVVSPSDGGHEFAYRLTDGTRLLQMTSQQLFMGRTQQLKVMDFTNLQWDGKFIEGGPMQEFFGMFEGWLYRYMEANGLYRAILPEEYRYWHGAYH